MTSYSPNDNSDSANERGDSLPIEDPIAELENRVAALEAELAEAKNKTLRLMADFQNSQRRAIQNEQWAKSDGVTSVVTAILPVIDHFDLALQQDYSKLTTEQFASGVRVIQDELLKVLQQRGVSIVRPVANDAFTPGTHEAIMQQAAEGVESGHIVACFQPGFLLGERVIRAAKVAVAP